jgi:predicted nucleic acid-binding Zn ribbon protein
LKHTPRKKPRFCFIINTAKNQSKGVCPVNCRITLNKERKQLNTGLLVNPTYWENELQKSGNTRGQTTNINRIRPYSSQGCTILFLVFQLQEIPCKLDNIFNEYKDYTIKGRIYIVQLQKYVSRIQKLVGIEIKQNTYENSFMLATI